MASSKAGRSRRDPRSSTSSPRAPSGDRGSRAPGLLAAGLPTWMTLVLVGVSFAPRVHDHPILGRSILGAAAFLFLWQVFLFLQMDRDRSVRSISVRLRPQHYIQAVVQVTVLAYWGYFWRPVYDMAWLIVAQLAFAYAFDILLS